MSAAVASPLLQALCVAVGSAVGALLRWRVGLWLNPAWGGFPLGTLLINASGGLVIGAAAAWLSQRPDVAVWPFAAPDAPVVLAEIYPSLLAGPVAILANGEGLTADQAQVRLLSRSLYRLARANRLVPLFEAPPEATEEGWILGAHHAALLAEALTWG